MRIFMFIFVGIALGDKLDRTYLPPPGSKFSGGTPDALQTPLQYPKETYSTTGDTEPNEAKPFTSNKGFINTQETTQGFSPSGKQTLVPTFNKEQQQSKTQINDEADQPASTNNVLLQQSGSRGSFPMISQSVRPALGANQGFVNFPTSMDNLRIPQSQQQDFNEEPVNEQQGSQKLINNQQRQNVVPTFGYMPGQSQLNTQNFIQPEQLPDFQQFSITSATQSPSSYFQNNIPLTTTSYAFTQTTISPFNDVPALNLENQQPSDIPIQMNYPKAVFDQLTEQNQKQFPQLQIEKQTIPNGSSPYSITAAQAQPSVNQGLQQSQGINLPNRPNFGYKLQQQNYNRNVPFGPQKTLNPKSNTRVPQSNEQINNYKPTKDPQFEEPSITVGSPKKFSEQVANSFQSSPLPESENLNAQQRIIQEVPFTKSAQNEYSTTPLPNNGLPQTLNQYQTQYRPVTSATVSLSDQEDSTSGSQNSENRDVNQNRLKYSTLSPISQSTTPINLISPTGSAISSDLNSPTSPKYSGIQNEYDEANRNAVIINYENSLTPDGNFSYSFDTSNGIHTDENGTSIDGVKAQGSYSYIGDDGKLYSVTYSADENGFLPIGDHLPTPPPIPDAIKRVIEQAMRNKEAGLSNDGSYDDSKYGFKNYGGKKFQNSMKKNKINPLVGADKPKDDVIVETSDEEDGPIDYETLEDEIYDIKPGNMKTTSPDINSQIDSVGFVRDSVPQNISTEPSNDPKPFNQRRLNTVVSYVDIADSGSRPQSELPKYKTQKAQSPKQPTFEQSKNPAERFDAYVKDDIDTKLEPTRLIKQPQSYEKRPSSYFPSRVNTLNGKQFNRLQPNTSEKTENSMNSIKNRQPVPSTESIDDNTEFDSTDAPNYGVSKFIRPNDISVNDTGEIPSKQDLPANSLETSRKLENYSKFQEGEDFDNFSANKKVNGKSDDAHENKGSKIMKSGDNKYAVVTKEGDNSDFIDQRNPSVISTIYQQKQNIKEPNDSLTFVAPNETNIDDDSIKAALVQSIPSSASSLSSEKELTKKGMKGYQYLPPQRIFVEQPSTSTITKSLPNKKYFDRNRPSDFHTPSRFDAQEVTFRPVSGNQFKVTLPQNTTANYFANGSEQNVIPNSQTETNLIKRPNYFGQTSQSKPQNTKNYYEMNRNYNPRQTPDRFSTSLTPGFSSTFELMQSTPESIYDNNYSIRSKTSRPNQPSNPNYYYETKPTYLPSSESPAGYDQQRYPSGDVSSTTYGPNLFTSTTPNYDATFGNNREGYSQNLPSSNRPVYIETMTKGNYVYPTDGSRQTSLTPNGSTSYPQRYESKTSRPDQPSNPNYYSETKPTGYEQPRYSSGDVSSTTYGPNLFTSTTPNYDATFGTNREEYSQNLPSSNRPVYIETTTKGNNIYPTDSSRQISLTPNGSTSYPQRYESKTSRPDQPSNPDYYSETKPTNPPSPESVTGYEQQRYPSGDVSSTTYGPNLFTSTTPNYDATFGTNRQEYSQNLPSSNRPVYIETTTKENNVYPTQGSNKIMFTPTSYPQRYQPNRFSTTETPEERFGQYTTGSGNKENGLSGSRLQRPVRPTKNGPPLSSQVVGEDFSSLKRPQGYDPETGYYYK